jgi:hypothetical protein
MSVLDIAIVVIAVIALLTGGEFYLAKRRESRILSQTNASVLENQAHSDAQVAESRRRIDAHQARTLSLLEEQNALLREILSQLKSGSR